MKSAREFIQEYFQNENRFIGVAAESGFLPEMEEPPREVILDVTGSRGATVVTAFRQGDWQKRRFSLRSQSGSWSFIRIETECICSITGNREHCDFCAGKGWIENYRQNASAA